ncbi:uncharacterized protein RCC_05480 [Ramularia collo-cygni]|uniref:Acetylxylan esterase n=1 Tax=Ramularia collo-cygni TaxID=112498 RepID=A0A2D3VD84_9PEZI|nr:uncharacterized protein RCC_05480 [Ramularia collo-cygni]CZT19629.1 uncharacterized protein RCC_05480 [Ramularia collo-cygni]
MQPKMQRILILLLSALFLFSPFTLATAGDIQPPVDGAPYPELHDNIRCVDGLHIVIATGYDESENQATAIETHDLVSIAKSISALVPNSSAVGVHYPYIVIRVDSNFMVQTYKGVHLLKQHIEKYINKCGENSKIALLGFAQGALIVTDAFIGSGSNLGNDNMFPYNTPAENKWSAGIGPIANIYNKHVIAAAVFSSPTAFADEAYSRGTAHSDGMYANSRGPLKEDGSRFRSYCDDGDFMCAALMTGLPKGSHTKTVRNYAEEASEFIVGAYERAMGVVKTEVGGEEGVEIEGED